MDEDTEPFPIIDLIDRWGDVFMFWFWRILPPLVAFGAGWLVGKLYE